MGKHNHIRGGHSLATASGQMYAWSDELERVKRFLESKVFEEGPDGVPDVRLHLYWATLDGVVCQMRETADEMSEQLGLPKYDW